MALLRRTNALEETPITGIPVETADPTFVRSERARRYRLTLRRDGQAVVVIPRRGSRTEAERFFQAHRDWLARARARLHRAPRAPSTWEIGTPILWRGAEAPIRDAGNGRSVCLGSDVFEVAPTGKLKPALERAFRKRAESELKERAWELAAQAGAPLRNVSVRNQRSRWGSCSSKGTVCLNWRLIQAPESVRDYIILHELAHLWEMNHSGRFWDRVESMCPQWRQAERWLKTQSGLIGM